MKVRSWVEMLFRGRTEYIRSRIRVPRTSSEHQQLQYSKAIYISSSRQHHYSPCNMMNMAFIAGAALMAAASANPISPVQPFFALPQSARFDNDPGLPAVAASPIGIYDDIYWQGFNLAATGGLQDVVVVVPNTPNNVAAFAKDNTATIFQGQPAMTVNYADSTIDHFDLYSFYYACVLATEASVAAKPQSCTLTIKGYRDDAAKELVAQQSFDFNVGVLQTNAQMSRADVSIAFRGLRRVNFFVSDELFLAGLVDTVGYIVYSKTRF
jgi:hypothetical protein